MDTHISRYSSSLRISSVKFDKKWLIKFLGGWFVAQNIETGLNVTIVRKVTFLKSELFLGSFPSIFFKQPIIDENLLTTLNIGQQLRAVRRAFWVPSLIKRNIDLQRTVAWQTYYVYPTKQPFVLFLWSLVVICVHITSLKLGFGNVRAFVVQ